MSCFRDPSGRPLCHIVEHPDRPNEGFCSTCGKRFQNRSQDDSSQRRSDSEGQLPRVVIEIITGILALFLAAVVNNIAQDSVPPPPLPPQQTSGYNDELY